MSRPHPVNIRPAALLVIAVLSLTATAAAAQSPLPSLPVATAPSAAPTTAPACLASSPSSSPAASLAVTEGGALPDASPIPSPTGGTTPEPDTGAGSAHGDVPDNAVFLTYQHPEPGFSIQYVEGWQVSGTADGVIVRDKDSSETVVIVPLPSDISACVLDAELPALGALDGFSLIGKDRVRINAQRIIHLAYHAPAPADPVTGKRVPSTVDRYYVPGPDRMAIVSLSTPDGVDNVDAFRQMIESLTWS